MIQKTKVLTLIVFGLIFLNLSAQEDAFANDKEANLPDENRKVRFGLQFSPNISWLKANSDGYKSNGNKVGFGYGLSVEYFINKNNLLSGGINLLYAGGDVKYKGTTTGLPRTYSADVEQTYNIRYIELPITLKLRTNEIGYFTYYGQFGIKAGFNYRANSKSDYSYDDNVSSIPQTHSDRESDAKGDINFMNLALVIGVGAEYNISGNTTMFLGLTFNNGFINQLDKKENLLDASGNAVLDKDDFPVYTEKGASANLNYLALNLGVYF
jgi:hypothetical protein